MKKSGKEIIIHYLTKALLENGFVLLPGGGVFYLQRYPARIDSKAESIVPPGYAVDFVPSSYVADYFLAYYIAEKTNTSFHFWNTELKKLSDELKDIGSGEQYELGGFGIIQKDQSDNLIFESNGLKGIIGLNELEVLPCKPIPLHFKTENPVSQVAQPLQTASPITKKGGKIKRKNSMGILGWFLIILATILLSAVIFDRCSRVIDDEIIDPPAHIAEDRFNQPPEKLYVDSFQKEDSNDLDQNNQNSYKKEYQEPEENSLEHLDTDTVLEEMEENEISEDEFVYTEDSGEAENDYLMVSGRCIIVTGSFSNENNITNQIQLLENLGYSVYTENIGNLTRVGALVDCNEDALNMELQYIRSNIESASWTMENN